MKVKFSNFYKSHKLHSRIFSKIKDLVKRNELVGGPEIFKFEKNFSNFVNIKHCITVANGTDALEIALESLKLKKGSEVIVPVHTWISTAEIIVRSGFKLVFCDIDIERYTIDVADLKKKISKKTSCIIPVHIYGNPSNMREINLIANKRGIKIIEDCSQAHGSFIKNKHVGTFGNIATFSFFPSKNLGAYGDGGAIVTNNNLLADYCRKLKNHGSLIKYDHEFPGRNSRLDSIQAAILNIKLKNLNKNIKKRNLLANIYFKSLKNIKEIKLPKFEKNIRYSYHQFVIRLNKNRNDLMSFLKKNGIETMLHYPYTLNELSFFHGTKGINKIPNAKNLGKKILSLPISEDHSIKEVKFICKFIINFFRKKTNSL
jgi:dTDP-4-amino-4,6-dideoxygalactose transaminase